MPFSQPNTADTISINYKPGQDFRDFPTQGSSIFTFGDYRITRSELNDIASATTTGLMYDGYESLSSLNVSGYSQNPSVFVSAKELNFNDKNPNNYAYFQTLKLDIAKSIDEVVSTWPYAVASINATGTTGYAYTAVTEGSNAQYSTIRMPFSSITNQGGVILNSGSTITGRSLLLNTNDYVVQLSGETLNDHPTHIISAYTFSAGTYLEFTFETILLTGQTSGSTSLPFWIRPNDKVLQDFYANATPLQNHLLTSGAWKHENPEFNDGTYITTTYPWPKTIDGFNPDIYGSDYNTYLDNVLDLAELIDCEKTDIMMRTMVPENFLDLDSDQELYRNTIQTFAHEFDIIKRYIDGISFAHTVTYNGDNSVPDKFLIKLAELLGWKLTSGFSELDLFKYLTEEVGVSNTDSKKEYDLQLWRRIMVNIIWLFKRKGTRDALQFIFKLIGAPDCMIRLEETVYDINQAVNSGSTNSLLQNQLSDKINSHGYIDYDASVYAFQEGGPGRGNGDKYINQWSPEFDPVPRIDNLKTYSGNPVYFGSENVINSKELVVGLDPAKAIECDMHEYYQQAGTTWIWDSGSSAQTANTGIYQDQYFVDTPEFVNPDSISGMSLAQWVEFVYRSNVDPTHRKISNSHNGGYNYHRLREIYLQYYNMTTPDPNQITFGKLENYLDLIEVQFYCAAEQLIPATSILEAFGTIYRNTVFNRQKYPYPPGINAGSEFQIEVPETSVNPLTPVQVTNTVNDIIAMSATPVSVVSNVVTSIDLDLAPVTIDMGANVNFIENEINGFDIEVEVDGFVDEEEIIEG